MSSRKTQSLGKRRKKQSRSRPGSRKPQMESLESRQLLTVSTFQQGVANYTVRRKATMGQRLTEQAAALRILSSISRDKRSAAMACW